MNLRRAYSSISASVLVLTDLVRSTLCLICLFVPFADFAISGCVAFMAVLLVSCTQFFSGDSFLSSMLKGILVAPLYFLPPIPLAVLFGVFILTRKDELPVTERLGEQTYLENKL